MSAPSMEDLKSSTDNTEASSDDSENEIPEEVQNAPSVNVRPEVMLSFDEVVEIGFTGDVDAKQNLLGEPTNGYGGSVAITVRDPTVGGGNLYRSTDEDQSADYKLFGEETSKPWEVNGQQVGVKYGQNTYEGEIVDDFEEEYATIYLNGSLGQYIISRLDAAGGFEIDEDDYDEPVGLFEYPPDDSDQSAALRRVPVLRADMESRAGALLIESGDSGAFLGTIFGEFDGEYGALTRIDSMDHDGYRDTSIVYRGDLGFDHSDGQSTDSSGADRGASTDVSDDDETVDDVDDLTMDLGDSGTTYDDLDGNWQTFVDNLVGHIDDGNVDQSKVPSLSQGFVDDNDGVTWGDFDGDDIAEIVESQL